MTAQPSISAWINENRTSILGIAVVSMLVTPADPFSMLTIMSVMLGAFELGRRSVHECGDK